MNKSLSTEVWATAFLLDEHIVGGGVPCTAIMEDLENEPGVVYKCDRKKPHLYLHSTGPEGEEIAWWCTCPDCKDHQPPPTDIIENVVKRVPRFWDSTITRLAGKALKHPIEYRAMMKADNKLIIDIYSSTAKRWFRVHPAGPIRRAWNWLWGYRASK